MRYFSVFLVFFCLSFQTAAEDTRIFMDSFINGQRVKLAFDTGAEGPMLFRTAANRLKLSIQEPPADVKIEPGKMKMALAEKCRFQITEGGTESSIQFAVVDFPDFMRFGFDGVLGWGGLKHAMFEMDAASRRVDVYDTINFDKSEWKCLDIRTDLNVLVLKTSSQDTTQDFLLFDTGSSDGLTITRQLWSPLVGDNDNANTTLSAVIYPGVGLVVDKEKWMRKATFGTIAFEDLPIGMGADAHPWLMKEGIDGILGIWGMSCYSWIMDGPAGKMYFRENDLKRTPGKYEYNRLGAVFVPEDVQATNALIAHVVKDGPADAAGIRDGDELLRVGEIDVTKWRTDPAVMPMTRFWERPAGTEIDLVLMRDGKKLEITVTLEEIFK